MVAYNFMARFANDVETGRKNFTIRDDRRRHARPGEPVQLYTGMRTRNCRKLINPDPVCERTSPILFVRRGPLDCTAILDGTELTRDQLNYLIVADGFCNRSAFFDFHLGNADECKKVLIRWRFWNTD